MIILTIVIITIKILNTRSVSNQPTAFLYLTGHVISIHPPSWIANRAVEESKCLSLSSVLQVGGLGKMTGWMTCVENSYGQMVVFGI